MIRIALLALGLFVIAGTAPAHELRPAIATVEPGRDTALIAIDLNLEAVVAGIGAGHRDTTGSPQSAEYDRLRLLPPEALADAFRPMADAFAEAWA